MSVEGRWVIICDHCRATPGDVIVLYRTYPDAVAAVEPLGWFLSPERDNSRYVFCPACMAAEADKILDRARN